MYFQIENTPESVRARRRAPVAPPEPREERPVLSLAPFSRPPQVLFENVPLGGVAERDLDIINPTNKCLQISLGRAPPPGLVICLPDVHLEVEPQHSYSVKLRWSPMQPTAQRETIHFTDQNRGRYDVILVLKTMVIKPANKAGKRKKTSPTKKFTDISPKQRITKSKLKVSPKMYTQKKTFSTHTSSKTKQYVTEMLVSSNKANNWRTDKENWSPQQMASSTQKSNFCPFDSPISIKSGESFNCKFTTSDMFTLKESRYDSFNEEVKQNHYSTYTEDVSGIHKFPDEQFSLVDYQANKKTSRGILSPSTRYNNKDNMIDAIDELTFTPLKTLPKIAVQSPPTKHFSAHPPFPFEDSLEGDKINNETHSILIKSPNDKYFQPEFVAPKASPTKQYEFVFSIDESSIQSRKIPNTSSPKQHENSGINFSINTEFSHISTDSFFPQRCSTERKQTFSKAFHDNFVDMVDIGEKTFPIVGLDSSKLDSPVTSMCMKITDHQISPRPRDIHEQCLMPNPNPRQLIFNDRIAGPTRRKNDRNCGDGVKGILEANLWQADKSPPRSLTPPLQSIPEESTQFSVSNFLDKSNKQFNTFTINRTFDKPRESFCKPRDSFCKPKDSFSKPRDSFCKPRECFSKPRDSISSGKQDWQKKSVKCDSELWKQSVCIKETKTLDYQSMQAIPENYSDVSSCCSMYHIGDVYTQSTTVDPFLSTTYFYDKEMVDKFENEFKRWLNYILTPPADLESNTDDQKIDVGKVWVDSKNKDVPAAPTKEQVSSQYHNSHRLESVRKSARSLLMSANMTEVFMKLNAQIDKKLIAIRTDKNLHLDIGLQKMILDLLLCYNPLWLRIGLETLYGTIIPLTSNSDMYGLSLFIVQRMFKDPYAKSKHSHPQLPNMLLPSYVDYIRKFTLKKYFMLVFFLDQAKQKKLIFHDPCLFCRNAPYKESRELLIRFTRELITGIGDITKHLRPIGYVVTHKQCYLDEFKYAVHNLAIDLKDGVRLSKVMEIILVKSGLMSSLRTPAISRLQKIHNVQVALNALKEANFNIVGDITAKDIAEGHREKTLSLLWQIIHVFQAPLFQKAAHVIQMWWKKKYLSVIIKKRIQYKQEVKRIIAASVIQCWWRRIQYNRFVEKQTKEWEVASTVIQKYWRMWFARAKYLRYKRAVLSVECWYLSAKQMQIAQEELKILRLKQSSATKIQIWYRRQVEARNIIAVRDLYSEYCSQTKRKIAASNTIKQYLKRVIVLRKFGELVSLAVKADKYEKLRYKSATIIQSYVRTWLCRKTYNNIRQQVIILQSIIRGVLVRKRRETLIKHVVNIQRRYRSKLEMKIEQKSFAETKRAVVVVQSQFKMLKQCKYYKALKMSVLNIETRYVAILKMRRERQTFLTLKRSTIVIQKYYRALIVRRHYLQKRTIIIKLQQKYKAHVAMKMQRAMFLKLKKSVSNIENRYIALLKMRKDRENYLKLKAISIVMQKHFRAAMVRKEYLQKRSAIIGLQQRYRAISIMRVKRVEFLKMRESTIIIQKYIRAYQSMRKERENYTRTRTATIQIQRYFRAYCAMKNAQNNYVMLKSATINIQRLIRAQRSMKAARQKFIKLKQASTIIQSRYRATRSMREQRAEFNKIKLAAVVIQTRFRANRLMNKQRNNYLQLKEAIITIEKYYISYIITKVQREKYLKLKSTVIFIQRRYRHNKVTKISKHIYVTLRKATLTIQKRFRAHKLMKIHKENYNKLRAAIILTQRKYRAKLMRRKCKSEYISLKEACVNVQARYRAKLEMRKQRNAYLSLKNATIIIQKHYRGNKLKDLALANYIRIRTATILLQRRFRAYLEMTCQRIQYLRLRKSVVSVQRRYRAQIAMKKCIYEYKQLRHHVLAIQTRFRANQLMKPIRATYLQHKAAANIITSWYRATKAMQRDRKHYKKIVQAVKIIEEAYKAYILMVKTRSEYALLRQSVLIVQKRFRANKLAQYHRQRYMCVRQSIITIQRWYKSILRMREDKIKYLQLKQNERQKKAAAKIQQWYIYTTLSRETRAYYLGLKQSVIKIQSVYRMYRVNKQYTQMKCSVLCIQRAYRSYRIMKMDRLNYTSKKHAAIKIQSFWRCWRARRSYHILHKSILAIQAAFRRRLFARKLKLEKQLRIEAATCIQKYFKRYLRVRQYQEYRCKIVIIQRQWRRVLLTRKLRESFVQARTAIVKLQALARGFLARRRLQDEREELAKRREEQRKHRAASKIQALFRGHRERVRLQNWPEVVQLRQRWNAGALEAGQETLAERNVEALDVLTHFSDMASIIRAFLTLDLLTEVYPMIYHQTANRVALSLIEFMMNANRSVSTLDTIRSAAAIIVNLARYSNTALTIYSRQKMGKILKLILRWSTQDSKYYRILCTFMWLFGKYDHIRKDLTAFLHESENHKMLNNIRAGVLRKQRMMENSTRFQSLTPKPLKAQSRSHTLNTSCRNSETLPPQGLPMPVLEPDYGLVRPDKPRFFQHDLQAIHSLFNMFNLPLKQM